jgi:hypothetical protein
MERNANTHNVTQGPLDSEHAGVFAEMEVAGVPLLDSMLGTVGAAPAFAAPSCGHCLFGDVIFAEVIFHLPNRTMQR